jgi:CubicO group peptidase (beta-lactamase class C family)
MKDLQQTIQSLLERFVADNSERGLQVAVYLDGEIVVDAATGDVVDSTTLFPVFSTTKGIEATLAHILVERGKLAFPTAFGHGGAGSSVGCADLQRRMAFGFTRNRFVSPVTLPQIVDAVNRALPPVGP